MFTFTDRAADDALLASSSLDELAQYGRDLLRLSNQAQAIAMQIARQIGQSTYNERLAGYNDFVPNRIRNAADKAAKGEISLQLGISRRQAGEWVGLDELLDEHPKIRDAFRAGDLRPHRLGVAIRGAATGPTGDLRERLADLVDNAHTDEPASKDVEEELTLDLDDPAADLDAGTDGERTDGDGSDGDGTDDGGSDDAASETDPAATDPAATDDPAAVDADEDEPWDFDDVVLDLASRPTTDTALRDDLDAIIISLDPDRAAEAHDDITDLFGDVTIGNEAFGHMTVDACIPAEHGVHLRDRISALISRRVCRRDGRSIKAQRVAAFAEIIKAPGAKLRCHCGDDTCPARQTRTNNPTPATAPTPSAGDSSVRDSSVDTTTADDTNTADQTADEPAMGGPDAAEEQPITLADIDEDTAVDSDSDSDSNIDNNGESSQSGTGTNAVDTAQDVAPSPKPRREFITAPPAEHDADVADAEPADDSVETDSDSDSDSDTDSDLIVPGLTLLHDPTGLDPTRLMGYGAIDPAHAARIAPHATTITARPSEIRTASGLIIFGNRTPAPPIDPTGHGGFATPPPGALTYRPSAALRAEIIQLDRRCRYPYCGRPSEECELDHLLKFCHADPVAGGWTVGFNLAPLCRPDHDRKHDGPWIPTMHTDRTISWRNARTGQTIVTYPR
ncbi:HNH endonuclease signature motif containing protein [Gordonia aquimaris]|uniref:HNH endonuclease signature motif containing protein n=1 Tax=Gordonia aquimaris TaxID=2984863 RepID=A0A9X3D6E2_9ACTN|nr:HNH endonuclease signature motif containing protein [Gordonia aquimaris]MCX2965838.1 HNH endonuclease signature motif containing protein [Gordonia aquimaris]